MTPSKLLATLVVAGAVAAPLVFALSVAANAADCPADPRRGIIGIERIRVDIETSSGTIKLALFPTVAPRTVQRFLDFVNAGYYEDHFFHFSFQLPVAIGGNQFIFLPLQIHTGGATIVDGDIELFTGFPALEPIDDEACLPFDRGAIVATQVSDFDGPFAIIAGDPLAEWDGLEAVFTVFGRVINDDDHLVWPGQPLGPAEEIGAFPAIDTRLNMDEPLQHEIQQSPVDTPSVTTLENEIEADTGEVIHKCFNDEQGVGVIWDAQVWNFTVPDAFDDPEDIIHTSIFGLNQICYDAIDAIINPTEDPNLVPELYFDTPETFTCPSERNPPAQNTVYLTEIRNVCSRSQYIQDANAGLSGELTPNFCFVLDAEALGLWPPVHLPNGTCQLFAVWERILEERRALMDPYVRDRLVVLNDITVVPEPGGSMLGVAALATLAALRGRGRRRTSASRNVACSGQAGECAG